MRHHVVGVAGDMTATPARFKGKRMLPISKDTTEDLVENIKKCRVSSTPGELRLKRDLVDCDLLLQQGVARFDKTAGNPLHMSLTFLCPIETRAGGNLSGCGREGAGLAGGASTAVRPSARVPTKFSVVVPKFYPHAPPQLYTERGFSRICPFVREDGQLQVPFLASDAWSSVSTMIFVVQSLLQGLQNYAAGVPQPWGKLRQQERHEGSCQAEEQHSVAAVALDERPVHPDADHNMNEDQARRPGIENGVRMGGSRCGKGWGKERRTLPAVCAQSRQAGAGFHSKAMKGIARDSRGVPLGAEEGDTMACVGGDHGSCNMDLGDDSL